jgi:hypothetical protein
MVVLFFSKINKLDIFLKIRCVIADIGIQIKLIKIHELSKLEDSEYGPDNKYPKQQGMLGQSL